MPGLSRSGEFLGYFGKIVPDAFRHRLKTWPRQFLRTTRQNSLGVSSTAMPLPTSPLTETHFGSVESESICFSRYTFEKGLC